MPADLLGDAVARLRTLALLYAFTYFMAGFFPALVFPGDRALLFSSFTRWAPGTFAIVMALVVAAIASRPRVSHSTTMVIGLFFEVISSYSIAVAEFLLEPVALSGESPSTALSWVAPWVPHSIGLSWVAPWVLLFTVVIPTRPRRAVLAALGSVSAVPVTVGIAIAASSPAIRPMSGQFFFWFIFPYLLIVLMAYVGARVVFGLGTEVSRARELGSYRLVERLGEGGMGEVWRASHRLLARPAAVKLIRPALTANVDRSGVPTEVQRRFEREAQVIALLRSPHTVHLFDFGIADDGAFYYVMELLDGIDLNSLVKRTGPLPAARVVHLIRQVCHSLSEAESHGLVHRDIKPANIFLCRYGEDYDFVKVLDFGIAKNSDSSAETAPALTQDNIVTGTPAFIAPEQAMGKAVDGRTDLYATGCVAYWLLTGEQVFNATSPMGLLLQHAQATPVPPSSRTELPIPPALDRIVLACLAKDPADRPQTARELSRLLGDVDIASEWSEAQAREWWVVNRPNNL